ncbi:MAG: DegT/DnrJ/EryC1/StrS family aminotransferase [Schleiferiaceae bacterium]|nr:DegT/DnrJ/EryC1/StrS family aminotransferase [Schleiferiaceae bacterium]MDP4774337.1 DegT/DnrJ/EryC1/StrS family aminotransferase [Schleiferiaceae bacterium]MDP4932828.1 DegT/DnrJ/EryC1/StrS family aminotransferase [Schleiferiaceae bacterium]
MAQHLPFNPPIPMVDLVGQHARIQSDLDQALLRASHQAAYIQGPDVAAFAGELSAYLGEGVHTIPCANGTDALQIALMALGLQPGDEVITATFTYVATAEVIALLGLTPVLVDVDPDTFALNLDQVRDALSPRTKAIVPVHLYGQGVAMESLLAIAAERGIPVVEDTAQALGARYTLSDCRSMALGTLGTIGCTSFFPSKNLGCMGDGGALFTRDAALAEKIRMIANHGQKVKYRHDVVGCNSRLDTLQAAVLRVKLRQLDEYAAARQRAAARYDAGLAGLAGIQTPTRRPESTHVYHQYTLRVAGGRRDALAEHLKADGIPTMIYYPLPLHRQLAYQSKRYSDQSFPVADQLCAEVLSLPMHTELTEQTQKLIIQSIQTFFAS